MKQRLKNYGLKIEFPKEGEYILGASPLPQEILQKNGQWDDFLPTQEYQNYGNFETYACTAFGSLSACEMLIKKKFNIEENFSDRWLAWNSGIQPGGTSPHTTCEFLRKAGDPLQEKWDFTIDINTWEKFYENPPPKLFDDARKDFLDKYNFGHEWISTDIDSLKKALRYSPLGISVSAWSEKDGINYSPNGVPNNHWVVCYGYDDIKRAWKIFDSYNNFIKLYSYDSLIQMAKRFHIDKKSEKTVLTWWQLLFLFFGIKK